MIYVKEEYKTFKYLVSVSDNYVVLTDRKTVSGTWEEPREYDIIYQYIDSPQTVIESTRTTRDTLTFNEIETSQDLMNTTFWLQLTNTVIIVSFAIAFLINIPTKLFKRGGVLFGQ